MATMKEKISRTDILKAIQVMKLRAESQQYQYNLETFVPVVDFSRLSTPNTQIIYGRNGTGKTHLLMAYYQHCEANYVDNKILPVYIDLRDLKLGPVLPTVPLEDLVIRFYRLFLDKVIVKLKEFSDKAITLNALEKIFGGKAKERKNNINKSIQNLYPILNLDQIEERVKEYARKVEVDRSISSEIASRIGISAKFSASKPEVMIEGGANISAKDLEAEQEKIQLVYRGLTVIDYEAIRSGLENIIELCGANAIVILVDEWSSVSLSIQPILAEMIRTTLVISHKISLKIVSSKYLTQTSAAIDPPQRIGLQAGIDVSPLADLDNLLNYDLNPQIVKDFLTIAAYKHVCQEIPSLKDYSVKEFEEYICTEIFDSAGDKSGYYEVVRASEGNPRDFLNILISCCDIARLGIDKKILLIETIRSAADYFGKTKNELIKDNPQAKELYEKVFRQVIQKRQKLFLAPYEKAQRDSRLQELWHQRCIHIVTQTYTVLDQYNIPIDYTIYSMDYGKLLSLKINKVGQEVVDTIGGSVVGITGILAPVSGIFLDPIVNYIKSTVVGEKLRDIIGRAVAASQGVETADIEKVEYLVKNCTIDELLVSS